MIVTTLIRHAPTAARRSGAVLERNWLVHRRGWITLASGLLEPFLYLLSIGIGMGRLVGTIALPDGRPVPYPVFLAPAMLAVAAMSASLTETTFNVFGKLRYLKLYDAVIATPVTPLQIAFGEIGWCMTRGSLYSAAFLALMAGMGLVGSWWGLLALPAAILIGFMFAALGMALTTFLRSWQDFDYVMIIIMVMNLFAGTFTPIDVYPVWLRPLVELAPLYHGVVLTRALCTGTLDLTLLGHLAFLLAATALGLAVTARRMGRLLVD